MRTYTDRDLRMLAARSSVSSPPGHRVPLDLAGANLEMATIPHIDLAGANLTGANLRGALLWGALLDDACLDDADLTCADLTWSSLTGCSMKGTRLVEADLDEALVDGALADAVTAGAYMITINPMRPPLSAKQVFRNHDDDAVLRAHRQSAPLSLRMRVVGDAYVKVRRLEQARSFRVLDDVDVQELLRWSASTGNPLNLRGCNLSGADLRNASLRGACLAFTNATGADIHGVDLTGADLENAGGWGRRRGEPESGGGIA